MCKGHHSIGSGRCVKFDNKILAVPQEVCIRLYYNTIKTPQILSLHSPVFQEIFYGNMSEADEKCVSIGALTEGEFFALLRSSILLCLFPNFKSHLRFPGILFL